MIWPVNVAAMNEVMDDVKEMTGKKSIYVTHSQGGRVGWDVETENVAAIVAIEPGGTPEIGSEQYKNSLTQKFLLLYISVIILITVPKIFSQQPSAKGIRDGAVAFAESYNKDGGNCTVVDLPKIGITGNSHFHVPGEKQ